MTRTVLIIDDEPNMRWVLSRALEQAGYTPHSAANGDEGLGVLGREPVDLVLLDLKLRNEDGLTVLRRLRERQPQVVVMMLTAYATVPNAVEAMQLGAADFLRKPFDVEEVIFKVARALERRAMQHELHRLAFAHQQTQAFESLIGADPAWQRSVVQAQQLARLDQHVMVWGEPGSGRTALASAIHAASQRQVAPLVEYDLELYEDPLSALLGIDGSEGAWQRAGQGSLVVRGLERMPDFTAQLTTHITSLSISVQPRLFIIASSPHTLSHALAVAIPTRLVVPPLRARPTDILLFAHTFADRHPLTPMTATALEQYDWPGNIPELRATIRRASVLAGANPIDVAHLPHTLIVQQAQSATPLMHLPPDGVDLEAVERTLIQQALARTHGNKSKAAPLLKLTRHTLLYRMEKYGITVPERS